MVGKYDVWSISNLRKSNLEPFLNVLQNLLISVIADERDRETLGTETACTTDAVKVRIRINRQIIVDGKVNSLNINTTPQHIRCNADTLFELFKFLEPFDTTYGVSKNVKRIRV